MRRASLVPVLLLLAALAGCHRGGAPRRPAIPAAALNAGGEPQWSAQVRGDQLGFSDGGDLALHVTATRTDHGKDQASWSGPLPTAPGHPASALTLTTYRKPCRDADTGLTYPFTAAVEAGGRKFAGCAAPLGQGLGPRS